MSDNNILPESAVGDREAMQRAIGKAITTWSRIEGSLNWIFQRAVTSRRSESASAAFAAIHSIEAQIDMTDAAVKMTYRNHPDALKEWKSLSKRLEKLRPKRNRLAHGQIVTQHTGGGPYITRFLPFYYLEHHHSWDAFDKWTTEEVEELTTLFARLAVDLRAFYQKTTFGEWRREEPPQLDREPDLNPE